MTMLIIFFKTLQNSRKKIGPNFYFILGLNWIGFSENNWNYLYGVAN